METYDPFEFFRFLLTVTASTYTLIRLILFIWHFRAAVDPTQTGATVLYHYLVVLVLRARLRRFLFDLLQVSVLAIALVLLIRGHW